MTIFTMFRSVHSVDPSAAALSTAFHTRRPARTPNSPAPLFADQLALRNAQEEAARLAPPFDLALSAQNHILRVSRERAEALLVRPGCPSGGRPTCEEVAAACRVLRAAKMYGVRPTLTVRSLDRLG